MRDLVAYRHPCPACGVRVAQDVMRDPETGEEHLVPWCPACGADLDRAARGQRPSGASTV
jgi:predicted RNA-binding Zn-ribbon protein involved in translation (DUF1610 family)